MGAGDHQPGHRDSTSNKAVLAPSLTCKQHRACMEINTDGTRSQLPRSSEPQFPRLKNEVPGPLIFAGAVRSVTNTHWHSEAPTSHAKYS